MSLGDKIKELRLLNKMTQEDVCRRINLEQSTLANYESGRRMPKPETILALAELFGVSTDYLLGRGDGEPTEYYHDSETAALAQELKDNPEYRALLDASRGLKPESIKEIMNFIKYQRAKEEPWRNDD